MEKRTTLEDLAEQQRRVEEMQGYVTALAIQARLEGRSWESIGKALNMTRQGAQQAFGPLMPKKAGE